MGVGKEYAETFKAFAATSSFEFICYFYNVYFVYSVGGWMIGCKVSEFILDGKELEFYEWCVNGGLDEFLVRVRNLLNEIVEAWSREEKDWCFEEIGKLF